MGLLDEKYEYDQEVDEESAKLAASFTKDKYNDFVVRFSNQLEEIERAIDEALGELWSAESDPIALDFLPVEQRTVIELVATRNKRFNKVFIVFSALIQEVTLLKKEGYTTIFPPFALHGEGLTGDDDVDDGDVQEQMGALLPHIKTTVEFVRRVYDVAVNFMHQLASLYSPHMANFFNTQNVHLLPVFESLGELLSLLVVLEEIIKENAAIRDGWTLYRRMLMNMKNDPGRFNTTPARIRELDRLLEEYEGVLFSGNIYLNGIDQSFDYEDVVNVSNNRALKKELVFAVGSWFGSLRAKMGSSGEIDQRNRFVGLLALYGLYFNVYHDESERALFKDMWEVHTVIPIIHLYGGAYLFPTDFLSVIAPEMLKHKGKADVGKSRLSYLAKFRAELPALAAALHLQVSTWMVRFESNLSADVAIADVLQNRMSLIGQGLVLAYNLGHEFKLGVCLHTALQVALGPAQVLPLCALLELIKAIQFTFHRRATLIAAHITHISQQLAINLQRILLPVRDAIRASRELDNSTLDALSGVELALDMLDAPLTPMRRVLIPLGLGVSQQLQIIREKLEAAIVDALRRLDLLNALQTHLSVACNTNYMYWSRAFLPTYFKAVFAAPAQAYRLPYMMAAIRDTHGVFKAAPQLKPETFHDFKKEIDTLIDTHIIQPLCIGVEKRLRHAIHVEDLVTPDNPFVNDPRRQVPDFVHFFKVRPLVLFDTVVNISSRVEDYLDTRFYNQTALSLYEWRKYDEMRTVAKSSFGLNLLDVHLPGLNKSSDALDVLQIMRNIHLFVAAYNYNLNTQTFVERSSSAHMLKTIDINHIANSIRTHGTGIMNTTVNFTFGFLQQKFRQFTSFLFDDHIQSPLKREYKWYKAHREEVNHIYPFERAELFNREIRKLGVMDGLSFLDRFRILVTEIGNAMGYVRMIRSSGLHHCASAIKFVPDVRVACDFAELAHAAKLSEETKEACRLLDAHVDNLYNNFCGGESDYFSKLVDVFAADMRSAGNAHLNYFCAIVPALTINFVEHMRSSKDRLIKKNKEGASYSDDGFALGVAYILKVLNQVEIFDGLHWFESVAACYAEKEAQVAAEAKASRAKADRETISLTLTRLADIKGEFDLLYYTFSGSLVFFRPT